MRIISYLKIVHDETINAKTQCFYVHKNNLKYDFVIILRLSSLTFVYIFFTYVIQLLIVFIVKTTQNVHNRNFFFRWLFLTQTMIVACNFYNFN